MRAPWAISTILWACGAVASLSAQDTRQVSEPLFPPVCARLGARLLTPAPGHSPSSETVLDSPDIQAALDSCPAGTAVELFRTGVLDAFLMGPIRMPKGVTLIVDAGVTVFASRNPRDYDANTARTCGTITTVGGGCLPLISVNRADGAGIMGYGTIDGRGELPMLPDGTPVAASWWDLANQANVPGLTQNCPRMVQISNTNGFTLYKITLRNSPNFHVAMGTSSNVTVWGIKIITPYDARNTDGIDPGYSNNVTVTESFISTGDDNVAVGGNNPPGAANISVVRNHFGDGHGASIGSYTLAGVSNVLFDQLPFAGTTANNNAIGLRIKSDVSRGGLVENITYSNICMQNVRAAIVLDPFYTAGATGTLIPQYSNITMRNVHATTEGTVKIQGHDAAVPTTITLDNVQIDNIRSSDLSQQYVNYKLGPNPVNFAPMLRGTGVTVENNVSTSAAPFPCPASLFAPIAGELIAGPAEWPSGKPMTLLVQVFTTKAVPYQTYLSNRKSDPQATLSLPAPTGTVAIYDGATAVGTAVLNGSSLVEVLVGGLSPGIHTLTVRYSGDARYPEFSFGSYPVRVPYPGRARRRR